MQQQNNSSSANSLFVAAASNHVDRSPFVNAPSALGGARLMSDDPSHVIEHMGDVVHGATGGSLFAGSTTSVPLTWKIEDASNQTLYLTESFPGSYYSLYLAQPAMGAGWHTSSAIPCDYDEVWELASGESLAFSSHPPHFYADQIDGFLRSWEAFCPILARKRLLDDVRKMVQ
jgi:hypothetical protein